MTQTPEAVVRAFFREVRSGLHLDQAPELLAPLVRAHQLTSENLTTVERSPQQYVEHVREMQAAFGQFRVEVTELLAQGDRVYVRWRQDGEHVGLYEGVAPTGLPVVELASAVYRVENGKITEYWIQIDRAGLRAQLERNASVAAARPE